MFKVKSITITTCVVISSIVMFSASALAAPAIVQSDSSLKFDDTDDIPHSLSTWLLISNARYKFGFWCIEKIEDKQVFSIIHNAEMSLIDINYFCKIVDRLVQECDKFEQTIANIMNS